MSWDSQQIEKGRGAKKEKKNKEKMVQKAEIVPNVQQVLSWKMIRRVKYKPFFDHFTNSVTLEKLIYMSNFSVMILRYLGSWAGDPCRCFDWEQAGSSSCCPAGRHQGEPQGFHRQLPQFNPTMSFRWLLHLPELPISTTPSGGDIVLSVDWQERVHQNSRNISAQPSIIQCLLAPI